MLYWVIRSVLRRLVERYINRPRGPGAMTTRGVRLKSSGSFLRARANFYQFQIFSSRLSFTT